MMLHPSHRFHGDYDECTVKSKEDPISKPAPEPVQNTTPALVAVETSSGADDPVSEGSTNTATPSLTPSQLSAPLCSDQGGAEFCNGGCFDSNNSCIQGKFNCVSYVGARYPPCGVGSVAATGYPINIDQELENSTEAEADVASTVDNIISPVEDDLPCPAIHVSGTSKDGVYVIDGKSCNTEWVW